MITVAQNMPTISEFVNIPSPIQYKFRATWEADLSVVGAVQAETSEVIRDHRGYRYYSMIIENEANAAFPNSRLDVILAGFHSEGGEIDVGAGADKANWFLNTARFTEESAGVDVSEGLLANDILHIPVATDQGLPHIPQYERFYLRTHWRGSLPASQQAIVRPPSATILLTLYP